MEKIGFLEISIKGSKGNIELTPDTFDIKEIISILENAENLLFSSNKKDRPVISYKIEAGSVKNYLKTYIQYIIGFNAVIGQVSEVKNIDFLDPLTAKAIENIQNIALKHDYIFNLTTSLENSNSIQIDRTTHFFRKEGLWVDAEFYFYGKVIDVGGKEKTNIHLSTDELGIIRIQTPSSYIENLDKNLVYKSNFAIRASGKQNSESGEIDTTNLKFLELLEYEPKYDESYLNELRSKAKKSWHGLINSETWLRDLRGGYNA